MGLFSYVIAQGITRVARTQHLEHTAVPDWFQFLADKGVEQIFLDGIRSSTVCSFSEHTPRAGIFINLQAIDHFQPSVDWFCYFHVPIWYRWGQLEARAAETNPEFTRVAPLPWQLQTGPPSFMHHLHNPCHPRPQEGTRRGKSFTNYAMSATLVVCKQKPG
jgi:hypothetical protein